MRMCETTMMTKIEVGAVVRLNCGGPKMVVLSVHANNPELVTCGWVDETGTFHEHQMATPALTGCDGHDRGGKPRPNTLRAD